uniref:Uncharacterized protein n=1 Tax=Meloidogyne incognita TaxID=6306 RepID=A0A914NEE0_MELIC
MPRHSAPSNLTSNSSSNFSTIFNKTTQNTNKLKLKEPEDMSQLLISIETLRSTTKLTLQTADAQELSADYLEEWAKQTPNNAIGDVVGWTCELLRVQAENQRTFAKNYENFLEKLRKVADTERNIQTEEEKLEDLEERERQLNLACNNNENKGENNKKFWSRKSSTSSIPKDPNEVKSIWYEVVGELMVRKEEVKKKRAEADIIKMKQFREAIKGIADSHCNFATTTNLIFSCQKDLAECVPQISTIKNIKNMFYDGIPKTRKRMEKLEKAVFDKEIHLPRLIPPIKQITNTQFRRRSEEPLPSTTIPIIKDNLVQRIARTSLNKNTKFGTPPPPYTPSAPTVEQLIDSDEEEKGEREGEKEPRRRIYPRLSPEPI